MLPSGERAIQDDEGYGGESAVQKGEGALPGIEDGGKGASREVISTPTVLPA
jgi:hypothetical protein